MKKLTLTLFNAFQITLNNKPIRGIASNKGRALLAYLAVEKDRPHRRDVLAEIFWPNKPHGVARNSLKQALANLRKSLGDRESTSPFLLISREEIQFNSGSDHWIDTNEFVDLVETSKNHIHQNLGTCEPCERWLREAVGVYRGDFLKGFSFPDSQEFEEWILINREALQRRISDALRRLSVLYEGREDYKLACQYARQLVQLAPWNEENHRALIRLLAYRGMRSAALRQYQTCKQMLAAEFGVEPANETITLYEKIRSGRMKKITEDAPHVRAVDQEPLQPETAKISTARSLTSRIVQLPQWVLPLAAIIVVGSALLLQLWVRNMGQTNQSLAPADMLNLTETARPPSKEPKAFIGPFNRGTAWYVSTDGDDSNDCLSSTTACSSINGSLRKPGFSPGDSVLVTDGIYTDIGNEVVLIFQDVALSGGWNAGFTSQKGVSTINGEDARRGITIHSGVMVMIERFNIQQGSSDDGGGVLNRGTLTLINSTIDDNTAVSEGGGISIQNGAVLTLLNSTICNNVAISGGGLFNAWGTLTTNNSTVSSNNASGGGGINNLGGTVNLNSSTITNNEASPMGGGGIRNEGDGSVTLQNSIIAGNVGYAPDCNGVIGSSGYNLIGNTSECTFMPSSGDLTGINPELTTLQDNTGPTLTHGLYPGSPAIDAGNPADPGSGGVACETNDQRGIARPFDGDAIGGSRCDIGAYEFNPASLP